MTRTLLRLSRVGLSALVCRTPRPRACLPPPQTPTRSYCVPVKARSYYKYLRNLVLSPPSPPYSHVCLVGDPVLRSPAAAVDPAAISGPEVQRVISTMLKVMRKLECVGISAPQVGVPLRIFAMEFTQKMFDGTSPESRRARGVTVQPLKIFINPQMKVLDGEKVWFLEGCECISGFSAAVPRYRSVELSGLDERGEAVTWQPCGWSARIAQHEMDHLEGVLYVDRMDSKTLLNINWQLHNS